MTWQEARYILNKLGYALEIHHMSPKRRAIAMAVNAAYFENANNGMPQPESLRVQMGVLVIGSILVSHGWPT
jgi:hypothetical protein